MKTKRSAKIMITSVVILLLLSGFNSVMGQDSSGVDLTELSLEDLGATKVTLVSRKAEKLSEAAAAIYVISNEDIKRAGCRSVAEALRLAPGLQVARIDNNSWAVTSRGLGGTFANKLLVLIDGRSVYTPLFSGVYWDLQDLLLEDVERIEVVRGPGATMWGANAVNGVINIITKPSSETTGFLAQTGAGMGDEYQGSLRYGGEFKANHSYRVWSKHYSLGRSDHALGGLVNDDWKAWRGGFRSDWALNNRTDLMFIADAYNSSEGGNYRLPSLTSANYAESIVDEAKNGGGSFLARWSRRPNGENLIILQAYVDYMDRKDTYYGEERTTVDVDWQHHWNPESNLELAWGVGFRNMADRLESTAYAYVGESNRTDQLYSAFVQVGFSAAHNLKLTTGSKIEHNDYTGYEYQPSFRFAWYPSDDHTVWGSVARAIRTPSRAEHDASLWLSVVPPLTTQNPSPLPLLATFKGTEEFKSEQLLAFEMGYRYVPNPDLIIDIAGFINEYHDLRSVEPGTINIVGLPPTYAEMPAFVVNSRSGSAWGVETFVDWHLSPTLGAKLGYTYFRIDFDGEQKADPTFIAESEGTSPNHQFQLGLYYAATSRLRLSANSRFVDELPDINVDSYWAVNARLAYELTDSWEMALVADELGDEAHIEYLSEFNQQYSKREPRVFVTSTWRF